MKKDTILRLFTILFLGFSYASFGQTSDSLTIRIKISNIKSVEGNIRIAVFDSTQVFLGEDMVIGKIEPVTQTGEMIVIMENLPLGEYAISIFHDENSNEILDNSLFKIPTEAYGFSNNARGKFGPPRFEDVKINFTPDQQEFEIRLK